MIQGSIASCILYAIFTSDLPSAIHPHPPYTASGEADCPYPPVSTYIDDIYLLPSSPDLIQTTALAQDSVDSTLQYMTANELKLNVPKTILMTISPRAG